MFMLFLMESYKYKKKRMKRKGKYSLKKKTITTEFIKLHIDIQKYVLYRLSVDSNKGI